MKGSERGLYAFEEERKLGFGDSQGNVKMTLRS